SVSLDPPIILVCIDRKARILSRFAEGARFAVNVLQEGQKELSSCFARNGQRFEGVVWTPGETGAPILPDVIAAFECSVVQMVEAGDHIVVLGNVSHANWREGRPLIYFNSSYQSLDTETSAS